MAPGTMLISTLIRTSNVWGSARAEISVTCPTWTPRKMTGAPTLRPSTELSKNRTKGTFSVKNFPPLKSNTPATMQRMAPTTKAPRKVGLILLTMMHRSPCRPSPGAGAGLTPQVVHPLPTLKSPNRSAQFTRAAVALRVLQWEASPGLVCSAMGRPPGFNEVK